MSDKPNWLIYVIAATIGIGLLYIILRIIGLFTNRPWIVIIIGFIAALIYIFTRNIEE